MVRSQVAEAAAIIFGRHDAVINNLRRIEELYTASNEYSRSNRTDVSYRQEYGENLEKQIGSTISSTRPIVKRAVSP